MFLAPMQDFPSESREGYVGVESLRTISPEMTQSFPEIHTVVMMMTMMMLKHALSTGVHLRWKRRFEKRSVVCENSHANHDQRSSSRISSSSQLHARGSGPTKYASEPPHLTLIDLLYLGGVRLQSLHPRPKQNQRNSETTRRGADEVCPMWPRG